MWCDVMSSKPVWREEILFLMTKLSAMSGVAGGEIRPCWVHYEISTNQPEFFSDRSEFPRILVVWNPSYREGLLSNNSEIFDALTIHNPGKFIANNSDLVKALTFPFKDLGKWSWCSSCALELKYVQGWSPGLLIQFNNRSVLYEEDQPTSKVL